MKKIKLLTANGEFEMKASLIQECKSECQLKAYGTSAGLPAQLTINCANDVDLYLTLCCIDKENEIQFNAGETLHVDFQGVNGFKVHVY